MSISRVYAQLGISFNKLKLYVFCSDQYMDSVGFSVIFGV
jgi:hypothetical protein